MAQVFQRSTNTLARLSIFGGLFAIAALTYGVALINRSSYVTQARVSREQPVMFSHKHHAGELGIDCRYCHTSVEQSSFAGIPPTQTCMNCHAQIWADSPTLEPVRASFRTGESIPWVRVHDLPDYVYFDHSIHVTKGIGCSSCHGEVDRMNFTWQEASLQMEWCLSCHRAPQDHIRPKSEIFNMRWQPPADQSQVGVELLKANGVVSQQLTNCSVCHR
ncbi:MAG TPA: cytochrome c3 family protein [Terriglobales bacterium]|nr:cytochrome c3 family protein [Terriglobales bacterium]